LSAVQWFYAVWSVTVLALPLPLWLMVLRRVRQLPSGAPSAPLQQPDLVRASAESEEAGSRRSGWTSAAVWLAPVLLGQVLPVVLWVPQALGARDTDVLAWLQPSLLEEAVIGLILILCGTVATGTLAGLLATFRLRLGGSARTLQAAAHESPPGSRDRSTARLVGVIALATTAPLVLADALMLWSLARVALSR